MAGENSDIRVRVGEDASSRYVGRAGAECQRAMRPVQARPCRHRGIGVYGHRDGLVGSSRQAEVATTWTTLESTSASRSDAILDVCTRNHVQQTTAADRSFLQLVSKRMKWKMSRRCSR